MTRAGAGIYDALLLIMLVGISLWWQRQEVTENKTLTVTSCQPVTGNCVARIDGIAIYWGNIEKLAYLEPFASTIKLVNSADNNVKKVSIEYVMQGMQMAANQSDFTKQSANVWTAKSVLPVCVSGRKDWLAIVRVETEQGTLKAGFQFTLEK